VRCFLGSSELFKYVKMNKAPKLNAGHREKRIKWAEAHHDWGEANWRSTVFSDEKKWNIDGSDGLKCYWRCLKDEPKVRFSRQNGGGSVVVWGGFWADGTTALAFLDGTQDSHAYIYTLSEYLLPAAHRCFGTDYTFQQDNASIHSSKATKAFLDEHVGKVMSWPAHVTRPQPHREYLGILRLQSIRRRASVPQQRRPNSRDQEAVGGDAGELPGKAGVVHEEALHRGAEGRRQDHQLLSLV
jgi:hypothetical protein